MLCLDADAQANSGPPRSSTNSSTLRALLLSLFCSVAAPLSPAPCPSCQPACTLHAASFLGGLMRMSASMCLILMEMTGACVAPT